MFSGFFDGSCGRKLPDCRAIKKGTPQKYEFFNEEDLRHAKQMLSWVDNGYVNFADESEKEIMVKQLKEDIKKYESRKKV